MFTAYQDYSVIDAHVPVLTCQDDGTYVAKDCYFLEFAVKPDDKTKEKIKTVCKPFEHCGAVQYKISRHKFISDNTLRLFLLAGPDTIRNDFGETDDFLAFALCEDDSERTTVHYFEVNYIFRHNYEPYKKYRRVGTSAAQALEKAYIGRELCGKSVVNALKFWLQNDFILTDARDLSVSWRQR